MSQLYLFPYNSGSKSARALAQALNIPVLRRTGSKFQTTPNKLVINWGCQAGNWPIAVGQSKLVNPPGLSANMSNKRQFFKKVESWNNAFPHKILIPPVFYDKGTAYNWWAEHGIPVFARTILNGHSGAGIVVLQTQQDWDSFNQPCNLFTGYVKKANEYRVHFRDFRPYVSENAQPKAFFVQRKATHQGQVPGSHMVRNLANGYIYVNEAGNLAVPPPVSEQVERFLTFNYNMGGGGYPQLQFGALDIIFNKHYNKAYILEVNTAPGLSGLTVDKYAEQFDWLRQNT